MRFLSPLKRVVSVAVFALLVSTPVFAQDDGGNAADGGGTGSQALSTEVDTSAFDDTLDRGGGGDNAAAAGGRAAAGGGGFGGFGGGGFGGLGALFGNQGFGNQGQGATAPIRTRLRSAIEVAPMPQQRVEAVANNRFTQVPRRQGMTGVSVNIVGRTAVLRGAVSSERDRRMSELLMRLEPGVSRIQNELVVSTVSNGSNSQDAQPEFQPPTSQFQPAPQQFTPSQQGQVFQGEVFQSQVFQGEVIQQVLREPTQPQQIQPVPIQPVPIQPQAAPSQELPAPAATTVQPNAPPVPISQ